MKSINIIFTCILCLITGAAFAEEARYYDIEVIVFESLDAAAKISESWKHEITMDVPAVAVELGQPYPGPIPKEFDPKLAFKVLTNTQLQLRDEAKLLTESKYYRVLFHSGWRQPGMDVDTALPVHINQSFLATKQTTLKQDAMVTPALTATGSEYQTRSTLNGYIKIILSRYLHADINLAYTTNIPMVAPAVVPALRPENENTKPIESSQPTVYLLSETRKMRSKEVHYIDHPVIGVILLATPYEGDSRRGK